MKVKLLDNEGTGFKKDDIIEPACYHKDTGDIYLYEADNPDRQGASCKEHKTYWVVRDRNYEIISEYIERNE